MEVDDDGCGAWAPRPSPNEAGSSLDGGVVPGPDLARKIFVAAPAQAPGAWPCMCWGWYETMQAMPCSPHVGKKRKTQNAVSRAQHRGIPKPWPARFHDRDMETLCGKGFENPRSCCGMFRLCGRWVNGCQLTSRGRPGPRCGRS